MRSRTPGMESPNPTSQYSRSLSAIVRLMVQGASLVTLVQSTGEGPDAAGGVFPPCVCPLGELAPGAAAGALGLGLPSDPPGPFPAAGEFCAAAATPMPVRLTVCGLLAASSAMLRVALLCPVACGANTTSIVQEFCAASFGVQCSTATLKSAVFGPVILIG